MKSFQPFLEALRFRYACKSFDSKKVIPDEDFAAILETGRLSPSSWGLEPWKFLVVQNPDLKEKLYPICWGAQNSLDGASHFVIFLARKGADLLAASDYVQHIFNDVEQLPPDIAKGKTDAYAGFQKDDFKLLESDRALFDWSCKQTYIALGNMLTAAAYLGIDSCPIEGFQKEAVEKLLIKEGLLDPDHFGVSVMAGFGYRNETPYPKTRQVLDTVVQWIR